VEDVEKLIVLMKNQGSFALSTSPTLSQSQYLEILSLKIFSSRIDSDIKKAHDV
jgi:hypothetical protein